MEIINDSNFEFSQIAKLGSILFVVQSKCGQALGGVTESKVMDVTLLNLLGLEFFPNGECLCPV